MAHSSQQIARNVNGPKNERSHYLSGKIREAACAARRSSDILLRAASQKCKSCRTDNKKELLSSPQKLFRMFLNSDLSVLNPLSCCGDSCTSSFFPVNAKEKNSRAAAKAALQPRGKLQTVPVDERKKNILQKRSACFPRRSHLCSWLESSGAGSPETHRQHASTRSCLARSSLNDLDERRLQ